MLSSCAAARRLLLHGVRAPRGVPLLRRRARRPRRRLHQVGARPRPARRRRRAALGARLLASSASAPTASRSTSSRLRRRLPRGHGRPRPRARARRARSRAASGASAASATRRSSCSSRWTSATAGSPAASTTPAPTCRIAQEMLLGIGGVRALHWLGHPDRPLPLQRGPRGVRRHRADRRAHGGRGMPFHDAWRRGARAHRVHHPHAGARRQRGARARGPAPAGRLPASSSDAEMRAIGGDPFNMTVAGLRLARRANAVAAAPRRDRARDVGARRRRARPIIAITNGVHAPHLAGRRAIRAAARATDDALWAAHAALKHELLAEVERARACRLDPDALDHRLRAPRGDLQAQRPHPARPGAARAPLAQGPARAARLLRQGAPRRPGRQGDRRAPGRRRSGSSPSASCSSRTTTWRWARLLTRGCDVWLNNPRAPARGERHLGHEGGDERRAQPLASSTAGGPRAASTASTAGRSATSASGPTRTRATSRRSTRRSRARCCPRGPTRRAGRA